MIGSEVMQYRLQQLEQRIDNLIRWGTIEEADYSAARVRVRCGEIVTDWLPWFTTRAGGNREWSAPEIGEQVFVLAPSGALNQAAVLPAIFQNNAPAPSDDPNVHIMKYGDGGLVEYNCETNTLNVIAPKNIHFTAGEKVSLNAPQVFINGNLSQGGGSFGGNAILNGTLTIKGKLYALVDAIISNIPFLSHIHPESIGEKTEPPE
ncbi:MAG: phage baseplate assembly protein V [Desulfovibrio sp.]